MSEVNLTPEDLEQIAAMEAILAQPIGEPMEDCGVEEKEAQVLEHPPPREEWNDIDPDRVSYEKEQKEGIEKEKETEKEVTPSFVPRYPLPETLFHGAMFFLSCSIDGVPVNELSSAVQKCIRRNEPELAVAFARRWFAFTCWEGKSLVYTHIIPNMIGRILSIIPFEDVLAFLEQKLVRDCETEYKHWVTTIDATREGKHINKHKNRYYRPDYDEKQVITDTLQTVETWSQKVQDICPDAAHKEYPTEVVKQVLKDLPHPWLHTRLTKLFFLIRRLCAAQKGRVGSDMRYFFSIDRVTQHMSALFHITHPLEDIQVFQETAFISGISQRVRKTWPDIFAISPKHQYTTLDKPAVLWWQQFFWVFHAKDVAKKNKIGETQVVMSDEVRKHQLFLRKKFWALLFVDTLNDVSVKNVVDKSLLHNMDVCKKSHAKFLVACYHHYTHESEKKESFLYPLHAMLAADLQTKKPYVSPPFTTTQTDQEEKVALTDTAVPLGIPIPEIPDYALDMHTRRGRKKNRGPAHFATIGAQVCPENPTYVIADWRKAYLDSKLLHSNEKVAAAYASSSSSSSSSSVSTQRSKVSMDEEGEEQEQKASSRRRERSPVTSTKKGKKQKREVESDEEEDKEEENDGEEEDSADEEKKSSPSFMDLRVDGEPLLTGPALPWPPLSAKKAVSIPSIKPIKLKATPIPMIHKLPFPLEGFLSAATLKGWQKKQVLFFQNVTSSWKQLTLLVKGTSGTYEVYKGPYLLTKANTTKRLVRCRERAHFFQQVGIAAAPMKFLGEEEDPSRVWIQMPYLGQVEGEPATIAPTFEMKTHPGWKGNLLDREKLDIQSLRALSHSSGYLQYPRALTLGVFYVFVRAAMKIPIGDTGFWNLLVQPSTQKVWMSGYEETWNTLQLPAVLDEKDWTTHFNARLVPQSQKAALNKMLRRMTGKDHIGSLWTEFLDQVKKHQLMDQLHTERVAIITKLIQTHLAVEIDLEETEDEEEGEVGEAEDL